MTPLYITPRRSIGPVISRFEDRWLGLWACDDGRATMLEIATDDPCEHPGYGTIEWAPVPPLLARRGALHPLVGLPGARWRVWFGEGHAAPQDVPHLPVVARL